MIHGGPGLVDLRPGRSITEGFPLAAWRAAWRQASYQPPPPGYPPGGGMTELRTAVAEHVRRVHGYTATEHQIVITSGPRHAVDVLLRTIGRELRCALAEPGPAWLRTAVAAHGTNPVPVPMDADGIRVDRLPAGVDAVLAAPDGGVPLGVRASLDRRERLAGWAERTGGWLVELGRETTTNPLAGPLPSLLSLGPPERTAFLGDLSELLTPAIGLGYLVLPRMLADAAARQIPATHEQPGLLSQLAAAELFRAGAITRWRDRLAVVHARKLAIVRVALQGVALEVLDIQVPGSATVLLPRSGCVDQLRRLGVLLCPLRESYAEARTAPNGVVLGFGHLEDSLLRKTMHEIAAALRGAGRAAARSATDS